MPLHKGSNREGQMLPKYARRYGSEQYSVWGDGRDRSGVTLDDYVDLGGLSGLRRVRTELYRYSPPHGGVRRVMKGSSSYGEGIWIETLAVDGWTFTEWLGEPLDEDSPHRREQDE